MIIIATITFVIIIIIVFINNYCYFEGKVGLKGYFIHFIFASNFLKHIELYQNENNFILDLCLQNFHCFVARSGKTEEINLLDLLL
jgi:hypothetical protein